MFSTRNLIVILLSFYSPFVFAEEIFCKSTQEKIEKNIFGLADFSMEEPQTIELLEDLGIEWVRLEIRWDYVQPERGKYLWEKTDRIIKNLRKKNINIQVVVDHPPVWAHPIESFNRDLSQFMETLVVRYKPLGVRYWEIFNEPNLPGHGWPFQYADKEFAVHFYSNVLETANKAIRNHDLGAVILNAGLSPEGIDYSFFLEEMYKKIGKDCFDILAFHPYGKIENLSELTSGIRKIMEKYGDENKPIWFNEYGSGDDSERAKILDIVASQLANTDGFIWFTLRDIKRFGWNFGLVEYNWDKKPDYDHFKKIYSDWKSRKQKVRYE